ncbi:MAG TPA: class I mannose-6-phosphate isomerase [Terracidiphilus sp.]|nr:class I mannose-6-phosphate isomerase [Terracidiphilus sp.]
MYDKKPFVRVTDNSADCHVSWASVAAAIRNRMTHRACVVCVECYPGVLLESMIAALGKELAIGKIVRAESCYLDEDALQSRLHPLLTDDPVFGRRSQLTIADFLDLEKVRTVQRELAAARKEDVLVIGTGASLVTEHRDVLVYADMARWEIQQRQRRSLIGNLGAHNQDERASLKYKRSYFVDWPAADRLKRGLLTSIDFLLDTNDAETPKLITGVSFHAGLAAATRRPFRLVPLFDPGPWGGHWMEEICDLPKDKPNHAWCFDCVPEENSLLLGFGSHRVEVPAMDLVLLHPHALLGEEVFSAFGAEFPIRFDFLDTMGGGNLSLQVHPLRDYIRNAFGMDYTQDESYYLLDAGEDASVYLGLREDVEPERMMQELRDAQKNTQARFDVERHVNRFPARKHDHFLIPAGTVHCSGRNGMVLEISATPYIFTFKLWDWGRLGLDGVPRPIHLEHGAANICWDRRTEWVKQSLINRVEPVASGAGWREERTGLHELQFLETRRHWFTARVEHHTRGTVHVLNLVEGDCVIVESPDGAFEPMEFHFAETFVVPASVGRYSIRPAGDATELLREYATIKAYVRDGIRGWMQGSGTSEGTQR